MMDRKAAAVWFRKHGIGYAPAIDAAIAALEEPKVEVVFCKDCVYLKDGLLCTKHHYSDGGEEVIIDIVQDKMFCALGKRAGDERKD